MRTALLALALLAAAPAGAQDCARFAEPLAYNACLARQGPVARAVHVGNAPARHGRVVAGSRRGRAQMVFTVGK